MNQRNHCPDPHGRPPYGAVLPSAHEEMVLADGWRLFEAPLDSPADAGRLTEAGWTAEDVSPTGDAGGAPPAPMTVNLSVPACQQGHAVRLPCDVHVPLIEAGLIPEPLEALNTDACAWVEDRAWWFVNRFDVDAAFLDADRVMLSLDRMDTVAEIFLNDQPIGRHRNAFRPFSMDVLPLLRTGANCLKIRITAGHESVGETDLGPVKPFVCLEGDRSPRPDHPRGDWRRAGLRKPQYAYGWDWGPRLVTCGLGGPVRLVAERLLAIRSVHLRTLSLAWQPAETGMRRPASADLLVAVELDAFPLLSTCEAVLRIDLSHAGSTILSVEQPVCLRSGWNRLEVPVRVASPHLWWPNGMGAPDLHEAAITIDAHLPGPCRGTRFQQAVARQEGIRFGIRTVAVDESPVASSPAVEAGETERRFVLRINEEPVFCKGGNWIPSDSLYLRISDEKYQTLVEEAARSGYNMLRIWGGGFYETERFHDLCDAAGLLVWQDLMFACSAFPDHLAWFREECAAEITHQAIRLRNHPGLVLWSGNNEIHTAFDGWWEGSDILLPYGGMRIWNDIAPRLLHQFSPDTPYWNSSPYGGLRPGNPSSGDVHHWGECMMNPDMEKRIEPTEFDKVTAKFVSEYGYIGPCRRSSIERYHGGEPVVRDGPVWREHNNTFEKDTVLAGIRKHYLDPDELDLEAYLLYAGLCQGLMYGYSLEALRARPLCAGAIYWMYNDTWGETGWTTIDYYLQRKISFPFVRRAFAPVKLILRPGTEDAASLEKTMPADTGAGYVVIGINEADRPVTVRLAYGYVRFDGRHDPLPEREVCLPPRSRGVLFPFRAALPADAHGNGRVAVHPVAVDNTPPRMLPATAATGSFRAWKLPVPQLSIRQVERTASTCSFVVHSDVYAHAVHFGLDERIRLSDEYFDLLPGETRRIVVESAIPLLPDELPAPRFVLPEGMNRVMR